MASKTEGDLTVTGTLRPTVFVPPASSIDGAAWNDAGAVLEYTNAEHEHRDALRQVAGSNVVAEDKVLAEVRGATGELLGITAMLHGQIPDDTRTVVVDLHVNGASVLSATFTLDTANTLSTSEAGTISSATLAQGDIIEVVVTVGGAAGTHPQGLLVEVRWKEDASL